MLTVSPYSSLLLSIWKPNSESGDKQYECSACQQRTSVGCNSSASWPTLRILDVRLEVDVKHFHHFVGGIAGYAHVVTSVRLLEVCDIQVEAPLVRRLEYRLRIYREPATNCAARAC